MAELDDDKAVEPAEAEHDDRRADIEAAFDRVTGEEEAAPVQAKATEPLEAPQEQGGRARGPDGKFLPKEETEEARPPKGRGRQSAQAELEPQDAKGPKSVPRADPVDSVPASLKPGLMEDWKATPRSVREEFHRREAEQYAHLEQTKGQRAALEQIQQAVQPYQALLQAEGGSVPTALRNYLQAATLMRQGSPLAKAQWIAKLTRSFTDQAHLPLLDQALGAEFGVEGAKAPTQEPNGYQSQQQFRDPRVDQMLAQQQQAQQYEWQQGYQQVVSEKQEWETQSKPEFLPWVKGRMATLLETAARDGEDMGFEEAYEAACRMNPEVRKILQQREEAVRAQPSPLQRSRRAAVSLRPQGAVAPQGGNEGNSRRSDIEDAWESVMGR